MTLRIRIFQKNPDKIYFAVENMSSVISEALVGCAILCPQRKCIHSPSAIGFNRIYWQLIFHIILILSLLSTKLWDYFRIFPNMGGGGGLPNVYSIWCHSFREKGKKGFPIWGPPFGPTSQIIPYFFNTPVDALQCSDVLSSF